MGNFHRSRLAVLNGSQTIVKLFTEHKTDVLLSPRDKVRLSKVDMIAHRHV
jgi:hypothetical protein